MKTIIAACLCFVLTSSVRAAVPLSAPQIIQKEGRLVFTDGSSVYDFEKDGTFCSGPLDGLSGRTIAGHWLRQFDTFVIRGTWGWVNGFSTLHDYRKMTLSIYPDAVEPTKTRRVIGAFPPSIPAGKMYRCYFVVDELVKVPSLK